MNNHAKLIRLDEASALVDRMPEGYVKEFAKWFVSETIFQCYLHQVKPSEDFDVEFLVGVVVKTLGNKSLSQKILNGLKLSNDEDPLWSKPLEGF